MRGLLKLVPVRSFQPVDSSHTEGFRNVEEILELQVSGSQEAAVSELREELAEAQEAHDLGQKQAARTKLRLSHPRTGQCRWSGGRARRVGSPAERARVNITRAIKTRPRKITTIIPHWDSISPPPSKPAPTARTPPMSACRPRGTDRPRKHERGRQRSTPRVLLASMAVAKVYVFNSALPTAANQCREKLSCTACSCQAAVPITYLLRILTNAMNCLTVRPHGKPEAPGNQERGEEGNHQHGVIRTGHRPRTGCRRRARVLP